MQIAPVKWVGAVTTALVLVVLSAGGAEAGRKYTLSGPTRSLVYNVPGGLGVLPLANPPGAHGTADQTGSSPANLTLPAGVWNQTGPVPFIFPVGPPAPPQYVQFASFAYIQAAPTATAMFSAGHGIPSTRPASFAFCPGAAANPTCATGAVAPNQGTRRGRVRYSNVNPNHFGGTMKTIQGGTSVVSVITATTPVTRIKHNPLNLAVINGAAYGQTSTGTGPPAIVTTGGVISSGGLITQPGTTVSVVAGFHRSSTGFPFTTGKAQVTIPPTASLAGTMWTATGTDTRTPLGAGNITMVAGALGNSSLTGEYATLETIILTLTPVSAVPSLSRLGIASMVGILFLGVLLVGHRRR